MILILLFGVLIVIGMLLLHQLATFSYPFIRVPGSNRVWLIFNWKHPYYSMTDKEIIKDMKQ